MSTELTLLPGVSYRGRQVTGPLVRNLLAALARDLRTGASSGRLAEELWPQRRPENPGKALQVLVFRARAQVPDVIVATPTGYRLDLDEDQLDSAAVLLRASAAARHARAGDHAAALEHAAAGLALFGSAPPPVAAPSDEPLELLRAERAPTHRALLRARALALSRLGRPAEALDPLAALAAELPRDEEVLAELLRSEAAARGPAAALARYDGYRRQLRDELGADPGPALRELHQVLLAGQAPAPRRTVPHEPNPLLGRQDDLAAVTGLLRSSRVVSIVGPGGLGKTRLANAVSRAAEERVVHVVPLAGVRADDDVIGEVAGALGVGEARATSAGPAVPTDLLSGILGALGSGRALLVLDNCEQVIAGVAGLVRDLVAGSGQLRVLTTSRSPLGLSSEAVYPLPELDLPTAVELFRRRARAVAPRAELPDGPVTGLCRHLDGLPLAIELAAARVRLLSVGQIADGLRDRFGLLRGHARDAPQRHRTLHAVVDWSWELLSPGARRAMRLLSVLPGGFSLDAARHLLQDALLGSTDLLDLLEQLVDQSLLKAAEGPNGVRFRMLETVREFAAAQREAAGETAEAVDGFLGWARELGVSRHETLLGSESGAAMDLVRAEVDNLLHAVRLAQERQDGETVAAACAVLAVLWTVEPANFPRLAALAEESGPLLSHLRPSPALLEPLRTAATLFVASMFLLQGARASRMLVTVCRLPPGAPDSAARATATILSDRQVLAGDPVALQAYADRPEPILAAVANGILSFALESAGDPDGALKAAERMLESLRDTPGNPWIRILAHSRIGELCLPADQPARAREQFLLAQRTARRQGLHSGLLQLQWGIALACLPLGDLEGAESWLEQARLSRNEESAGQFMLDLGIQAEVLLARGETEAGLRLWRRAVDRVRAAEPFPFRVEERGHDPETLETEAVAVVAHARHGRLDQVAAVAGELPGKLAAMLAKPLDRPPMYLIEMPLCGTLLRALAAVELARAPASGARLVALAEAFRYSRAFHPTMSAQAARQDARAADAAAYEAAVRECTGRSPQQLRRAALDALARRPPTP